MIFHVFEETETSGQQVIIFCLNRNVFFYEDYFFVLPNSRFNHRVVDTLTNAPIPSKKRKAIT